MRETCWWTQHRVCHPQGRCPRFKSGSDPTRSSRGWRDPPRQCRIPRRPAQMCRYVLRDEDWLGRAGLSAHEALLEVDRLTWDGPRTGLAAEVKRVTGSSRASAPRRELPRSGNVPGSNRGLRGQKVPICR